MFLLLLCSTLHVSLGSHCEMASILRENKLRAGATPFDWLLTMNHKGLCAVLEEDFAHFLEPDSLFFLPNHVIENSRYKIEFRHDHMPFPEVQQQYERRIRRFREIRNHAGKVIFFRIANDFVLDPNPYWKEEGVDKITADQAVELRDALKRFFPTLDFMLVIVNYTELNVEPIEGIEQVLEFKIRKSDKVSDYANMLTQLQDND